MNGVLAPTGGEDRVAEAARIVAAGGKVLLAEGAGGGECAIVVAAEHVTPQDIVFMTRQAGGPICLVLTAERCDELGLRPLSADADRTAFTVTVEAASGVTTGISASDQAQTIRVAADPEQGPEALVTPGHVRPVRARRGGVLERPHTAEASVDLVRIAGRYAASVTCPVQREDGERTREAELLRYAANHSLHILTVEDVRAFCREADIALERGPSQLVKTERLGTVEVVPFAEPGRAAHLALVKGDIGGGVPAPVFVHAACRLGALLGAAACDCGQRLDAALEGLAAAPAGVLVSVDVGLGAGCAQLEPPAAIERRVLRVLTELDVVQAAHAPL